MRIFYGWWVVGGAFILLFCAVGTQFYAFPVFFDAMLRDLGWSRAQTAMAFSIGHLVMGLTGLFIGKLIRKIEVKVVLISGSIVAGIGFALLSTTSMIWEFYVFYGLILSIGIGCISLVPNMTAVESWFVQKKSTALGIAVTGIGAGGAVIAPVSGWLISIYDWRIAFLFLAVVVTLIGVPVSAIIMQTSEGKKAIATEDDLNIPMPGFTLGQAIKQKTFWLISIGAMLWDWAYVATLTHQVAFAVDMGIGRVIASGAVGTLTAFSILGRLGFGRLGDVIDKRYVFMIGTSLQIAALIVLLRATNVTMLYIYSFLIGVNIGGIAPILPGLISDYFGRNHFGAIYGTSFFILLIGGTISPVYAGWIFDSTGSYSIAFLTNITLSFLAIIIVYLAGKSQGIFTRELRRQLT